MVLLTDKEYKLLKLLYRKRRTVDFLLKHLHISDAQLQELVNGALKPYIVCCTNDDNWKQGTIEAIEHGKALYEERKRSYNRYRTSLSLSIAAIIISIVAVAISTLTLLNLLGLL